MISKRIVVNLVVFFSISALLVGYGAVTLFGSPFDHRRTVVADLPDAGGLRPGFSASLDGVVVGTVSEVELRDEEVRVTVELDEGVEVPSGVEARVIRASAVGEQRLDLASTPGGSRTPLADGAEVPVGADPIPPDVADVLQTATDLIGALPAEDLNTLIHEAALGVDGRAEELQSITRSLSTLSDQVVASDDDIRLLLDKAPGVLDDFSEMSPAVHDALDDTEALTGILAARRDDLALLLANGADLAEVGDRVLLENRANLTCLLDDLTRITGTLQGETLAALDESMRINQQFFGLIDKVAAAGPAKDLGAGPHDQLWLRTKLLVPPQTPAASAYAPPRGPRPVLTGAACESPYGDGAAATPQPTAGPGGAVALQSSPAGADGAGSAPAGPDDLAGAVPLGQASEEPASNPSIVPLLVLGAGVLVALASLLPAARTRRRAP